MELLTHRSPRGELASDANPGNASHDGEKPQHVPHAEVLDLHGERGHQTADDDQRRGEDHAGLSRVAVGYETQQHDAEDLPHDERVRDPRLLCRPVCTAVQMGKDDIDIGSDLLLIAVGKIGSSLGNGHWKSAMMKPTGRWGASARELSTYKSRKGYHSHNPPRRTTTSSVFLFETHPVLPQGS